MTNKIEISKFVPRERWGEFFDQFSNGNRGRRILIEIIDSELGSVELIQNTPLMAMIYDRPGKGNDLVIEVGQDEVTYAHTIDSPTEVLTGQDSNGLRVKRTIYNQYDSLVRPLQSWLAGQDVQFILDSQVTDLDRHIEDGKLVVTGIHYQQQGERKAIAVENGDLVFLQNGSMTDASSLGSMTSAPKKLNKQDCTSWNLWEKLAAESPDFGNPAAFNRSIAESLWESFTVTLKNPAFFDKIIKFSGNQPGTGELVTFKDSNWLMSIVIAYQPHFINQPADVQVFWGYALFPDRVGNFVPKPMSECNGAEIFQELCGHLRFDLDTMASANCIPCRMPYITSMFMPRLHTDRPLPIPLSSKNLAFISQFVEIPDDVVFTVEYSVRAAQMAVYEFLHIDRKIPPVTSHDKSLHTQFAALAKAFK